MLLQPSAPALEVRLKASILDIGSLNFPLLFFPLKFNHVGNFYSENMFTKLWYNYIINI